MNQAMKVLTSKETTEWYTPPEYIDMVRAVLGDIDLDPASAVYPQSWIQAKVYYTFQGTKSGSKKALDQQPPWIGNVWLNAPFDNTAAWTKRMRDEYNSGNMQQGIQLVNSNLGYNWFEEVWREHTVCFVRDRIAFINEMGKRPGPSKQGQAFIYYGEDDHLFRRVFGMIGRIIQP